MSYTEQFLDLNSKHYLTLIKLRFGLLVYVKCNQNIVFLLKRNFNRKALIQLFYLKSMIGTSKI
jgi:hypothetical protein